jgi:hypothetical protein
MCGAEGPVTGRAQHHHVHGVVGPEPVPQVAEIVDHRLVEGVHHLGPVQRDGGDAAVGLEQHGLVHPRFRLRHAATVQRYYLT